LTAPGEPDPIVVLNSVLSEVIDVVSDVKQADRKVPATHALHAELDQLLDDLRSWVRLLGERDDALGVSPLTFMPSVAGRTPSSLWREATNDDDVRRIVGEHLERLGAHVAAALADRNDDTTQAALADVERGVQAHLRALA